jgi:hypothetical protein
VTGSADPAIVEVAVSNVLNAWTAGARSVIRMGGNALGATLGRMLARMAHAWDAEMQIIPSSA